MYILPVVSALASISLVSAKVLNVLVGINGVNNFMPTAVLADAGDTIMFQFAAKNHSVTQSSFDHPCQPLAGGVSSPFFNVQTTDTMAPEWGFTVVDTSPIWFYCAQTIPASHCSQGMVFAVNPPLANKTFNAFQSLAVSPSPSQSSTPNSGSRKGRHAVTTLLSVLSVTSIGFLFL